MPVTPWLEYFGFLFVLFCVIKTMAAFLQDRQVWRQSEIRDNTTGSDDSGFTSGSPEWFRTRKIENAGHPVHRNKFIVFCRSDRLRVRVREVKRDDAR